MSPFANHDDEHADGNNTNNITGGEWRSAEVSAETAKKEQEEARDPLLLLSSASLSLSPSLSSVASSVASEQGAGPTPDAAVAAQLNHSDSDSGSDESYEAFRSTGVAGLMTLGSAVSRSSSGHLDMARVSFESRLSFDAYQGASDTGSLFRRHSSGAYSGDSSFDGERAERGERVGGGDTPDAARADSSRPSFSGRYPQSSPSSRRSSHLIVPDNIMSVNSPITRREDIGVFSSGRPAPPSSAIADMSGPETNSALNSDMYYTL